MLEALIIALDGDFERPLYAEPEVGDCDPDLVAMVGACVEEVFEGERKAEGTKLYEEWRLGWKVQVRLGLAFCAVVTDDVSASDLSKYISAIAQQYGDEIDDARSPDSDGIADLLVDVIPPWED
ncbi:MAG: hypothetical protein KC912_14610 [Proteobacteria bacterium]|nr:hypothetical protein [Pseudomonadota bacterium]